ncbi:family 1 glycosylhydrolase [Humibacter albus]|uniref:family 1 glycosylhydrolase n=1 Tax=Humibacter albus TaxID=427754 RepID=UPI0003B6AC07|nr:family 1 glycosylhydrolase [Humibacter albus]
MAPLAHEDRFGWILGIEDTCVYPHAGARMQPLDEFQLTEHDANWRDDLRLARDLGATAVRYGTRWPLVHVAPGRYDWSWLEERFEFAVNELGLRVIADLVHYGTPTWLEGSFADPSYPEVVADYEGTFASHFAGLVDDITPLNEPVTTASFCGLRGVWPPALTGWEGWTAVVLGVVRGMQASIRAIREANGNARIVHVEASALYSAESESLADHAVHLESVGMLPTDLLTGRVTRQHPMHDWLLACGASERELDELVRGAVDFDLLGVNYYPDLSPRTLTQTGGAVEQRATNLWTRGLVDSVRGFIRRYDSPVIVTETSIEGTDEVRSAWVDGSVDAVRELTESGADVRGYTWWPLVDFVDWSYASGGRNVEEFVVDESVVAARTRPSAATSKTPFLRRMGLVRLEEQADGSLLRVRTPAAERFVAHARGPVSR